MEFWDCLQMQLEQKGFLHVQNKNRWYWRAENPVLYLICLLDGTEEDWREENMTFADFAGKLEGQLADFCCTRAVALSILVDNQERTLPVDSVEAVRGEKTLYRVLWQFSPEKGQLFAEKGQPTRILGIERLLYAAAAGEAPEVLLLRDTREEKAPVATALIFVICAAVLARCMLFGQKEEIFSAYGLSRAGILSGQYYRFFTCMFLHAGLLHLASNSIYLYYFGVRAERLLGTGRFLVLYLISGLCGGICSVLFGGGTGVSVGASGAIYGLLGAMLLLTKKHGARYTGMNYSTMLLLAATAIAFGFLEEGVDNFAHIGGFLGGLIVFSLLLRRK